MRQQTLTAHRGVLSRLKSARRGARGALLGALLAAPTALASPASEQTVTNLADLSIEQLMNESVTSVARKQTKLAQSPAAIAVVTQEDFRRLGFTTIAEALRLAPGLDVARINANQWAISSRGFNYFQYANKLLVLMDGRSVYTPTFGGVFWDTVDTDLADLDRIEVIRGPGATLWGANAVNGVVNIITKSARVTQGTLIETAVGTEDRPATTIRYGGRLGTNLYYRAYVKYFSRDGLVDSTGADAPDAWNATRSGFRMDWEPSWENALTLQGDYSYSETAENINQAQPLPPFVRSYNAHYFNHGGNLLGRWTRTFSDTSQLTLQSYYDHNSHEVSFYRETRDTADVDLQHRFALGTRHDIVWGAGYRFTSDELPPTPALVFNPERRNLNLATAFVQDEFALVPGRLKFIAGSKFEHNDFTGFEVQPSGRLLWTPTERQTVWASVSRAVRTPTRLEADGQVNRYAFQPSMPVIIEPNPDFRSEELVAYELGYRIEPVRRVSVDVATFYNVYHDLVLYASGAPLPGPPPLYFLIPQTPENGGSADTYGAELSVQWQVTDFWRLAGGYSWYHEDVQAPLPGMNVNPQQQAQLRSYLDLPHGLEFNAAAYYVDRIDQLLNTTGATIPAYVRLDLGLVWRPTPSLEVGVWGQNLLDGRHAEFNSLTTSMLTEIPRSVLGRLTLRF